MFRGPLESGAPPPWVGKMMKASKDVGLVVVGADLAVSDIRMSLSPCLSRLNL